MLGLEQAKKIQTFAVFSINKGKVNTFMGESENLLLFFVPCWKGIPSGGLQFDSRVFTTYIVLDRCIEKTREKEGGKGFNSCFPRT